MTKRLIAVLATATLTSAPGVDAQRKPLAVPEPLTVIAHNPASARLRYDTTSKTWTEYAVEGRIDFIPSTQNFELSWNGKDGTRQKMTWEPWTKVTVIVSSEVTFDSTAGLYTYSYTFANLANAAQKLRSIYLEAGGIERAVRPDTTWYSTPLTDYVKEQLVAAAGWSWSNTAGELGIPPGKSVSGFRVISPRPPAVVKVYAAGRTPNLASREEIPDALHAAIDRVVWKIPVGFTVGPSPVEAANLPTDMTSLVTEATRQGWLGSATSADQIRNELTTIEAAIGERNLTKASERITELLEALRATRDNGVLSEGRALLEYRLLLIRESIRAK